MFAKFLKVSVFVSIVGTSAYAAPLWMRRSEVSIPADTAECVARAFRSFRAEGFAPVQNLSNGVWGSKGERWTLIVCNAAPANNMWVNIVSASAQSEADEHYRDHERVGARMSESSTAPVARTGCGWRDGQDSAAPDSGRGVTNWDAHFRHVNNGPGLDTVHTLLQSRLSMLSQCLPLESYARLYAEVSAVTAAVGRQNAGWVDGMDETAGGDPGRGVSNKDAHYRHVASGAGASAAHIAVGARMASLRAVLSRETYARLYADLSVLIAQCGVSGRCG
jgi:hypothetical protein